MCGSEDWMRRLPAVAKSPLIHPACFPVQLSHNRPHVRGANGRRSFTARLRSCLHPT
jgi:hypothetical protein